MILLEEMQSPRLSSALRPRDLVHLDTEMTLLEAARTMDKGALMRIFDLYASPLYNYALRLCGDPVKADQTVGDVFAKFLDQLAAGRGPRLSLRAYLYKMTYHCIVDEARHAHRIAPLEVLNTVQREDSAFVNLENRLLFDKIMQAIRNDLTTDQRHVIILRFLEGMSIKETAAIIGKHVNNVKMIQTRAIEALRKRLMGK
jgi:RNA polymerase sigma-70 factor, ECF subfamily